MKIYIEEKAIKLYEDFEHIVLQIINDSEKVNIQQEITITSKFSVVKK